MVRTSFLFVLVVIFAGAGCGYGSHNYMNGSGNPVVNQLSPNGASIGSPAFTMTVNGTGFGTDAVVYWGTTPLTTTYGTTQQVSAMVPATDIQSAGMVQVYVHSGGRNSNAMTFTIQ